MTQLEGVWLHLLDVITCMCFLYAWCSDTRRLADTEKKCYFKRMLVSRAKK